MIATKNKGARKVRVLTGDKHFQRLRKRTAALQEANRQLMDGIQAQQKIIDLLDCVKQQNDLILNAAGDGIYGLDLEGRTTFINPAGARLIGWPVEELIGKPQHAILHHTRADGTPYPHEECPIHAAPSDGAVHQVDDEVFWRKDGTSFPVEYVSTPIRDQGGEVTGAVVVFKNIAKRKRTENELAEKTVVLETTLENMSQGISVYDADLKLVAFNQKYVDLRGYPPGFLHIGMSFEEVARFRAGRGDYGPGDVERHVRERVISKRTGELRRHEFTLPDGTVIAASRETMPDGGSVTTFTDITRPKRAEEALRASRRCLKERLAELQDAKQRSEAQGKQLAALADDLSIARDEAEAANRAKSEFLTLMSHELRTPLNAIIGFSEIIKGEMFGPVGTDRYRDYAGDVHESGRHLLALINDILDLSKIEAGKLELDESDVDVAEVIHSCLRLVRERAGNGGVRLVTEIPEDLPALRFDERKLKQILINLLSNAVKFTPAGGTVTVKAWFRADSGYVFQVIDTGIGIAIEDIPKALTSFGRIDSKLARKYEGTGLGLPLTKSLVELSSGSMDLQSEVGIGTTVTVRFPKERIVVGAETRGLVDATLGGG
ncbi:MAG: PAS-domain containing protein [Proteobacteria bacterium]|nr:PAS-domain containing protein [Pseudomonadota bacterium]